MPSLHIQIPQVKFRERRHLVKYGHDTFETSIHPSVNGESEARPKN